MITLFFLFFNFEDVDICRMDGANAGFLAGSWLTSKNMQTQHQGRKPQHLKNLFFVFLLLYKKAHDFRHALLIM